MTCYQRFRMRIHFRDAMVYANSMAYEFPTDIRERLQARIGNGSYCSEDDVIRDAMDALDEMELDKIARWNERNQLAISQSEQGLSAPLEDEEVLARLRARLAQEGIVA